MVIKLYGKDDCAQCEMVKKILPDAEYHPYDDLFEHFGMGKATRMITASDGDLPIIVIKTPVGVIQLKSVYTLRKACNC